MKIVQMEVSISSSSLWCLGILSEQSEEDSRCLEHLQLQLVDEKSKRARVERENAMLQEQVNMLMNMLQEAEQMGDEGPDEP